MPRRLLSTDATRALNTFASRDLSRGRAYYAEGRVSALQRTVEVEDEILFTADVRGSARRPYTAYLVFDGPTGKLVEAECTCPLGGRCKHCVATVYALVPFLGGSGSQPARVQTPLLPPLDRKAELWLDALAEAGRPAVVREPTRAAEQRLLFTLSLHARTGAPSLVQLQVDRASVAPDGTFGARRFVHVHTLDWARDPAASRGDHALVVRMGTFSMGYVVLDGAEGARLLADVVATGRGFLETDTSLVKLVEGERRSAALTFESDDQGWQRPGVSMASAAILLPLVPLYYVDPSSGATGPIEVGGAPDTFAHEWIRGSPVSPLAAGQLARRLASIQLPVRPPSPTVRRVREVDAAPTLVLRLESQLVIAPDSRRWSTPVLPERPWVRVFFDYAGERVDPAEPWGEARLTDHEIVTVRRADDDESDLLAGLADAGLVPVQRAFSGRAMPEGVAMAIPKLAPFAFASRVTALASASVRVEKAPDYAFDAIVADEVEVGLDELPESIDHFAVSLGIRVGDETFAALPLVLAALREHVPAEDESLLVTLPDGRVTLIAAARLLPLRRLLLELLAQKDPNRVPRVRALALDPAVLARSPESLAKLRAALASPRRIAVPKALRATLREYQREGFVWLMARRRAHLGAVLADDMGLGKTIQTLALLLAEDRGGVPSLVVCPKSVLGNWEAEAKRFAPSLVIHVHNGADRASRTQGFTAADVVLTTYPLLARDADFFASQRFATVVLDEAQIIKTATSTFTHAACALRADFRLALSGTPMENHVGELWSVMRFALPELFGEARAFTRTFRKPIERDGSEVARRELVTRLSPFVLRRRKEQVASELPPKTIIVEPVVLDDAQRDVYETVRASMDERVRQALAERGIAQSHIIVLDALLKLRQAVCDPRLLRVKTAKNAGSAKLDVLVDKLRELVLEGRRVLVFSQFVTMLELVQAELRREKIPFLVLTGQTENRAALVDAFQRGDAPVFLLSLKAGGTGLNLTAADVVIHYDPWWNPAAEAQATDRAHRIGQDKPVLVYKLVGKGTIEEKILALQEKKRALFTSVMDDGAGAANKLTAADVEFLFAR
jgi:superfamily II DNA or RNA helicase